jgi:hypothetical protein
VPRLGRKTWADPGGIRMVSGENPWLAREVAEAYFNFIYSEQVKGNVSIMAQDNTPALIKFLDVRYRC